jgi:hypothetical protein
MLKLFGQLRKPEDDSSSGGGAVDRGDDFTLNAADAQAADDTQAAVEIGKKGDTNDEPARDDKGRFIPKARFDEQVGKERAAREAAERQLAELQAQLKQVNRNADVAQIEEEIKSMEKQHAKLLLDGDHEKAAELMSQIRFKERQVAIQEATHLSAQAKEQAREEIRVEIAIEKLQTAYPQLDENHEDFDEGLVNLVLAEQRRLIEDERLTPSKALTKAATDIMKRFVPAKAADDQGAKGLAAAQKGADRKAAQVQKNLDASKRQPPDMKDVGMDSDKAGIKDDIDVSKLSFSEFEALPEATKARLRGDLV